MPFLLSRDHLLEAPGRLAAVLVLLSILAAGCQAGANPDASEGAPVVASTTILADIARNVAGNALQVTSLLPEGADPHEYQSSPADVQKLSRAKVLIINGLEYERFIQPLIENAGGQRLTITASSGLEPRQLAEQSGDVPDPHMWLDPTRVIKYVENIRDGLSQADPQNAAVYEKNAAAYIGQLQELDAWIKQQVSLIPVDRRLLVTNHGSMGYFSERYGFTVVTQVIPGISTDASSSARQLAQAIDRIKAAHAPAVFLGELENPDLARQIAAETGATVVNDLYLESLSKGPPAATYIDLMKHNVERIVEALR